MTDLVLAAGLVGEPRPKHQQQQHLELLDGIAEYNEFDCVATRLCRDWLISLKPGDIAWFDPEVEKATRDALDVYRSLGAEVQVVEMLPKIAPAEDDDISEALHTLLQRRGITFHLGVSVSGAQTTDSGVTVEIEKEGKKETLTADRMFVAIGHTPAPDAQPQYEQQPYYPQQPPPPTSIFPSV